MNTKDIVSGVIMLIFIYLLISGGSSTSTVINSLSSGFDGVVGTLQGRTVSGQGVSVGSSTLGGGSNASGLH